MLNKKKKLVFVTHNPHKFLEVAAVIPQEFELLSLKDIDFGNEIAETGETLEENALIKVNAIHNYSGLDCFADDTGLEVEALAGKPGVYSARYAGENANDQENLKKLLSEMSGQTNRKARFRTVFALRLNKKEHLFEGIVNGKIAEEAVGNQGFGYDPVFIPKNRDVTFAQMEKVEKAVISHRSIALSNMVKFMSFMPLRNLKFWF